MSEQDIIKEREKKILDFINKKNLWIVGVLIIALILGIYIRSLPMQDHGGNPGLWDISTNSWTLGPDLDPWLFVRTAEMIVNNGSIPETDMMRSVPLGQDTTKETMLLPYMIAWTYKFLNIFMNDVTIELAGDVFPVIMFALTILTFFFMVKEIFEKSGKRKAEIIAGLSTFFMIVIPAFISRTIAGIPEKESAGFCFMFLAYFLFIKSWKSDKLKNGILFAIGAGISTGIMGLIWGGVIYIFVAIALSVFIAFMLNKVSKKELLQYLTWVIVSCAMLIIFSNKYTIGDLIGSTSSGLMFLVLGLIIVDLLVWKTKFKENRYLSKIKLPKKIISILIFVVLGIILCSIVFGPMFLVEQIKEVHQMMFKAVTGRWNITVAENRQPYFTEWASSFGPYIKNIPIMFWMFFVGSALLFKKLFSKLNRKDVWIVTLGYVLFLSGMIFSRYAEHPSILDGDSFLSKSIYYLSALLLIGILFYEYRKYGKDKFEEWSYEYIFLFSLFILSLFSARTAVRLIMVLAPIAPIFASYLMVESVIIFRKNKEETMKIFTGIFMILVLIGGIFAFVSYYQSAKATAYYGFVPNYYNQQWQKGMDWVRTETSTNAVFAHWWDYGYWVQSIGDRATIVDGGNAIVYWNYLMGRLVLTGDNQQDSLDFLYSHNATHLLIDSSDIGKYSAFSSIGSDENYDRYSWITAFLMNDEQTQETKNKTAYVYTGGYPLDEDLIVESNGKDILLPQGSSGIGAILVNQIKGDENTVQVEQPIAIVVYNSKQYPVKMRYLYMNGKMMDFKTGINATAYVFPKIDVKNGKVSENPIGAIMYLSPRVTNGFLGQVYILNDPWKNFPNFKLAHTESNLVIESLRAQGMDLPEFVYYQDIQGPIKIWNITYTGEEEIKQEYLDKDSSKYLTWKL